MATPSAHNEGKFLSLVELGEISTPLLPFRERLVRPRALARSESKPHDA